MTIKEVRELPCGTKLKFLDAWPEGAEWPNSSGEMDHWLGQVVTLKGTAKHQSYFHIEEDSNEYFGGWFWHAEIVEYIVDEGEEFDIAPESDFSNLFEVR